MKKKHFILFIVLLITSLGIIATWFAFATQPDNFSSAPLTTIEIPQDSINLKTIRYDEKPQAIFTLKNTGSHPLLIKKRAYHLRLHQPTMGETPRPTRTNKRNHCHVQAQLARTFYEKNTGVM